MESQRLIALSLGKIAVSRQQRGGINLHKNLLVASVLHKARTSYMMENFQTMLAKKAQADSQRAVVVVEEPPKSMSTDNGKVERTAPASDASSLNGRVTEAPHGVRKVSDCNNKENVQPAPRCELTAEKDNSRLENSRLAMPENMNCSSEMSDSSSGSVSPLQDKHAMNGEDYVSRRTTSCRFGNKRRRSFVETESGVAPKKPKMDEVEVLDNENCENTHRDALIRPEEESMQTDQTQITNLVSIFNTGFSGLYKTDSEVSSDTRTDKVSTPGQVNVYVTAERQTGHSFVLSDGSTCSTQVKERDGVSMPTVIALAV